METRREQGGRRAGGRHGPRLDPRRPAGGPCGCDWPGCTEEGDFPAPRGREQLRDYRWLCLAHVREFNSRWDYFAGMSQSEIEAHIRDDVTWHRPTWRAGGGAGAARAEFGDPFGFFADGSAGPSGPRGPCGVRERMMAKLGLEAGFTLVELKRRYKELAKQHHPDLHGGDKAAEERLKSIIEAYTYLLEHRAYA
jgi:hypothetical protein